jgi:cytochrome d ubiquinol oxidase subunit II
MGSLEAWWFAIAVGSLAAYVVLDGFDFGAGALHRIVARTDAERRQVLAAIGPFWDGNEVWLLASGGVLFLAFPRVLASGLSGFYLAIMFFLWILIGRGLAIELRSHVDDPMWRSFWDTVFAVVSTVAPLLLGVALGNLVRGVPLDERGWFALPLFDDFWFSRGTGPALGLLDVYTVTTGLAAVIAIQHHGALFLAWKTDGEVADRARRAARRLFPATVATWALTGLASSFVVPGGFVGVLKAPASNAAATLSMAVLLGGLVASAVARRRGNDRRAFLGSCAFIAGALGGTAAVLFPTMLRAVGDPARSLTAWNAAAAPQSLRAGLWWWPLGCGIAIGYFVLLFRLHRGRVQAGGSSGH